MSTFHHEWCITREDKFGKTLHTYSTYDEARYAAISAFKTWIGNASDFTIEEWNEMIRCNKIKICHLNQTSGEIDTISNLPDEEYLKLGWMLKTAKD